MQNKHKQRIMVVKPKNLTKEEKSARKTVVISIANDIFSLQEGGRKMSYGVIGREMKVHKNIYPWLTDDMMYYQISLIKQQQQKGVVIIQKK